MSFLNAQNSHKIGSATFTTDDTLTMSEDNVLRVTVPVKGATKAELNSMTDEQKRGLIVVTDEDAATGEDTTSGGDGGRDEVYSTEETRIGTWIDGKPLYRKVCIVTTPDSYGDKRLSDRPKDAETFAMVRGFLLDGFGNITFFPCFGGTDFYAGLYVSYNEIRLIFNHYNSNAYTNKKAYLILEYTKTTDKGVVE